MKVLMISKACLVGAYQKKLEAIGQCDDVELTVIVPPLWQDAAGTVHLERSFTDGYDLLVDPIRFNGQFHFYYFPKLGQRMAAIQPDILHIDEEPYNLAAWLAWRQARQHQAQSLFFSWQNLHKKYPLPFQKLEAQVLAGVDYALMGNQDAVEVWQAKGYAGPAKVVPQFGVDPDIYKPPAQRDHGRGFIIGAANRRLVPEKGVDLLIRAAAGLPGIWRLHVAGDGPSRPSLQQLARDVGIADRVFFDGPISSAEMPAYLQQLDVLVLSSRSMPHWKEQFGRILIEAMACETAVIGADSGEIPHVIGEAGLIFAEDDVEALRAQLLRLMQNEAERKVLGCRGRERILENYTQQQIAAQTVAVYRDMLAK
jgi:glycosyltransferase involved in cell wall biosynthesis